MAKGQLPSCHLAPLPLYVINKVLDGEHRENMLREIILRELVDHLRSLRFSLTFLLVTVLMLTGSVLYIHDYRQLVADYSENVNENLRLLKDRAKENFFYRLVSWETQSIYRSPNPLGFIAEGHEKDLPNVFEVDAFELKGPEIKLRGNYTLWKFDPLDWVFIIGVILSFAALVLTYDSISGEREAGTLRLCLSNALPRSTLLLGKFIGVTIILMIPLIVGICMSLLVVSISGVIPLEGGHFKQIGVVALLSILYISTFVAIGLFVSSLTRTSAVSLILLLLAWVFLVIIIPKSGGLLASELVKLPSADSFWQKAMDAREDIIRRHGREEGLSGHWSPGEPPGLFAEVADAQIAIYGEYLNRQTARVKFARNMTRISPTAIYQIAGESLAGSGINHYERFLKQAREYRRALSQYTLDKSEQELRRGDVNINFDEIPKFAEKPSDVSTLLADAMWNILLLFLFNVVLFMGAFWAFMRYDV
jgi:ABC-type transport system involved in multi-copper enzyme maturation permease subunit